MKNILVALLIAVSINSSSQDSVTYTKYPPVLGYLVGYDSAINFWYVKRIFKVEIWQTKRVPCTTVYHWNGDNKDSIGMYWHIEKGCDSCGPCGGNGFAEAYFSKFVGDSVVSHECEAWKYSIFKEEYYQPAKTKEWKIGEKYELKSNEHFAEYKRWYPPDLILICG